MVDPICQAIGSQFNSACETEIQLRFDLRRYSTARTERLLNLGKDPSSLTQGLGQERLRF